VLRAAAHALCLNARYGDEMRLRLAQLVMNFRKIIGGMGLANTPSILPVQMLALDRASDATPLQRLLLSAGVRTAVVHSAGSSRAKLVFVITASHSTDEIHYATGALKGVLQAWARAKSAA
jgi:7-keto-8-aminopelargonate synthetase-like enzyme